MNKSYSELDVLFDVVEKLNELHIDYMLTGSLAMNYYAEPRMTRDLDFIIEINEKDIDKFVNNFKEDYYISKDAITEALHYNSSFNIIHSQAVIKIDFLIRKKEEYRKIEFDRKQTIKILDNEINVVSKEDLIISKLFWAKETQSEQQKNDIINLLNTGYDKEYLLKWLEKLDLIIFIKEFIDARYFD
ncbi:MAG: hypothetical protein KAT68_18775 [Bacteroidales bacterium]|nr:hypothetical protein [Bacteroidales bacterium]